MISLPPDTASRLQNAYEDLQRAKQRWQDLRDTTLEMADVDSTEDIQIDFERGVIEQSGSALTGPTPDEDRA